VRDFTSRFRDSYLLAKVGARDRVQAVITAYESDFIR
jgi:hypothetical protein